MADIPSQLIFGHCDLLSGNIIIQHSADGKPAADGVETVSFIDYEYGQRPPTSRTVIDVAIDMRHLRLRHLTSPTTSANGPGLTAISAFYLQDHSEEGSSRSICKVTAIILVKIAQTMERSSDYSMKPTFSEECQGSTGKNI